MTLEFTALTIGRDRLLDWAQVGRLTGLGRSTVWRMRKAGDFPEPALLSPRRVAWRERDIIAWIRSRSTASVFSPAPAAPDPRGDEAKDRPL